jgi:hypothetical protein
MTKKNTPSEDWTIDFDQVLTRELGEIRAARKLRRGIDPGLNSDAERTGEGNQTERNAATDQAGKAQLLGLAFSGGGIRSATFNLGVLQALAEMKLLPKIDYLSTVSGGGYIGSWFAAWVRRSGLEHVQDSLRPNWRVVDPAKPKAAGSTTGDTTKTPLSDTGGAAAFEPKPIRFLRQYSNYLTPKTGWFGADTWTVVSIYLRNLLLNLVILVLALGAIILLPRIIATLALWINRNPGWDIGSIVLGWVGLLVAIILIGRNLRSFVVGSDRRYPGFASQGGVQKWVVIPLFIGALCTTLGIWSLLMAGEFDQPLVDLFPWWTTILMPIRWGIVGAISYPLIWGIAWVSSSVPGWRRGYHKDVPSHMAGSVWKRTIGWGGVAGFVAGMTLYGVGRILDNLTLLSFGDPVDAEERVRLIRSIWPTLTWGVPLIIGALTVTMILHIGLMGLRLEDAIREWMSRVGAWLLIYTLGWIGLFSIAVYGPGTITWLKDWVAALGTGWILSTISGILAGQSAMTGKGKGNRKLEIVALVAPYVFVAGLLLALSYGIDMILPFLPFLPDDATPAFAIPEDAPLAIYLHIHWATMAEIAGTWGTLGWMIVFLGAAAFLSFRVDINEFSMHLLYRNRLVRCYLGASNHKPRRRAHPFTGFDPNDDMGMHDLWKLRRSDITMSNGTRDTKGHVEALLHGTVGETMNELDVEIRGEARERLKITVKMELPGDDSSGGTKTIRGRSISYERESGDWMAFPGWSARTLEEASTLITSFPSGGQIRIRLAMLAGWSYTISVWYLDQPYDGPYPIINTALNLVGGDELAWQQRKATSFILSPLYCGYDVMQPEEGGTKSLAEHAYCLTDSYASRAYHLIGKRDRSGLDVGGRPITLGTSLAISGAAASPNMGYHSSTPLAFLLTVFNVRLGWWLGNPRRGDKWQQSGPRSLLIPLLLELFGLTSEKGGYIYLSDGGHFENLGIYELVRRRCRFIIACDAGADPEYSFGDLGNAIEKCRADMGIDIQIDIEPLRRRNEQGHSQWHCAIGRIRYDLVSEGAAVGTLLYIKSSLTGDEPTDVLRYAAANPGFPHQSTGDQWFDESQFESYRMLGYHAANCTFKAAGEVTEVGNLTTETLFLKLRESWYPQSLAVQESFSRHTRALSGIFDRIRGDKHLRFLDQQIYPEWRELIVGGYDPAQNGRDKRTKIVREDSAFMFQLPKRYEELRRGFYICNEMIQLMEDVYIDLKLESDYDHPDNRGWMNLFRHWAWSGMVRATWMVSASTYGARFQEFCRRHLDLRIGTIAVQAIDEIYARTRNGNEGGNVDLQSLPLNWLTNDAFIDLNRKERLLNPVELRCIERICNAWKDEGLQHLPNRLYILRMLPYAGADGQRSPEDALEFSFGFMLGYEEERNNRRNCQILYFRVQDHLRTMGLARRGLRELMSPRYDCKGNRMPTGKLPGRARTFTLAHSLLSGINRSEWIRFKQMFYSVEYEVGEKDRGTGE